MNKAKKQIEKLMKKHNLVFILNPGGGAFYKLPKGKDPGDCINTERLQVYTPYDSFDRVLSELERWLGEK